MTSYRGDEAIDWFGFSRLWSQTVGYAVTTSQIDFFVYCTYNNINRTPRTSQRCAPGETFFYTEIFYE